jgi:hypothetical protein
MAIRTRVVSRAELKRLDRKHHSTLLKHARRLVRTSPEIRKIIKGDRRIQKILKQKLRPTYNRLERK